VTTRADLETATTFHEATVIAECLSGRQLERLEARLRRRYARLDAAGLTRLAAVRAVLRERGHAVPPIGPVLGQRNR
jgi:hypothetical protein